MTRKIPIALLEDGKLTGRRLGRKPTTADIEAACEMLRRLPPDEQKCVVWMIKKMAEREQFDG